MPGETAQSAEVDTPVSSEVGEEVSEGEVEETEVDTPQLDTVQPITAQERATSAGVTAAEIAVARKKVDQLFSADPGFKRTEGFLDREAARSATLQRGRDVRIAQERRNAA